MTDDTAAPLSIRVDPRGVARVTLDMPGKRNVLTARTIAELTDFARTTAAEGGLRAVVLTGAGAAFCAGADLGWMRAQLGADRARRMAEARRLAEMLEALNTMPVPLIGRINGATFGGGLGLACICDVAVAAAEAQFCFSETRLGIIPATIAPYVLARLGEGMARRVFMSARLLDAAEAARIGLVARVVPAADLDAATEAEVAPYLSVAPGAVAAAKRLARRLGPPIDAQLIEETIAALADAWDTEEAAHGITSFLDKRRPRWAPGS